MKVWQKDFALYIYTPGICAGAMYTYYILLLMVLAQIPGVYIYTEQERNITSCYKRNIKSTQGEVFPGKRVSLGDIIQKMGLGIFWGNNLKK